MSSTCITRTDLKVSTCFISLYFKMSVQLGLTLSLFLVLSPFVNGAASVSGETEPYGILFGHSSGAYARVIKADRASARWSNIQPQYGVSEVCPPNTECRHSSTCEQFRNTFNNGGQLYYEDRHGSTNCGYEGSGFVCCPQNHNYNNGRTCGTSLIEPRNYLGIGTFPFVVRIGYRDADSREIKFPCSGSIIGERIILTAAHCALAKVKNFKLYMVRIGEFDTNTPLDCGNDFCALPLQDITISHVIVHPGYQQQLFKDDIALLVLNAKINFSVTAQPICLPEQWFPTANYATLVGWGEMAGQTDEYPHQQAVLLPVVNLQQCIGIYSSNLPVNENHLCVGGERGRDACSGFGGSPLLEKQGSSYYQVGILSFGSEQCGAPGVPSVYTNIKNYVTWIKENIPLLYN